MSSIVVLRRPFGAVNGGGGGGGGVSTGPFTYYDNFDVVTANSRLQAPWITDPDMPFVYYGGHVRATDHPTDGANRRAYAVLDTGTPDHKASARLVGSSLSHGLAVRATDDNNCYRTFCGGGQVRLFKRVNGVETEIAAQPVGVAIEMRFELEASGSTITARVNGNTVLSVTDTSLTTGTRAGLFGGGGLNYRWDDSYAFALDAPDLASPGLKAVVAGGHQTSFHGVSHLATRFRVTKAVQVDRIRWEKMNGGAMNYSGTTGIATAATSINDITWLSSVYGEHDDQPAFLVRDLPEVVTLQPGVDYFWVCVDNAGGARMEQTADNGDKPMFQNITVFETRYNPNFDASFSNYVPFLHLEKR